LGAVEKTCLIEKRYLYLKAERKIYLLIQRTSGSRIHSKIAAIPRAVNAVRGTIINTVNQSNPQLEIRYQRANGKLNRKIFFTSKEYPSRFCER